MKKILFTGGGSAGHVIPNIALIDDVLQKGNIDVCYMGTSGLEKRIVAERKIPYYEIHCPKLIRGGGWIGFCNNVRIPFALSAAIKEARRGLEIFRPDLVFSKGGYVALPVVLAARKLKIPCFAHESDFSVGLANRLTAKKCERVFTSFAETADTLPNGKYSGAPIRKSLFHHDRIKARKYFSLPLDKKVVLVFGGGSGSAAINQAVRKHLKSLTKDYAILHVCGKDNVLFSVFKNYRQEEFVADMGMAYACADLVVSRAGAGTVFEILALKKPSILIPLEGQTRGDQKQNAEYFQKRGLCCLLPQKDLDRLPEAIAQAFADKALHERLSASNLAQGNENILREVLFFLS